jgi:outer membrane protein OmpA-like peptidoglycan-associated protein
MKHKLLVALLGAAALVAGCATKNYVRQTVHPVDAKVDQVTATVTKQGTEIDDNTKGIAANATKINAVDETATSADRRAGDAMNKANQADAKADKDAQDTAAVRSALQNTVANLDSYKVTDMATVNFGLNQAKLSADDKMKLDTIASGTSSHKRYFIAVEGYTDKTGGADYNLALSRRRADAVVQYLAGEKDVDFNRIHMIGFGDMKPVDPDKTRAARAKNRRVEVKIYSADEALAAAEGAH